MRGAVALAGWVIATAVAAAPVRPAFVVPASAQGDGKTAITLRLQQAPARVKVEVSAGTLRSAQRDGTNLILEYVPPRTAAAMQVALTARSGRSVVARATLPVSAGKGEPAAAYGFFQVIGTPLVAGGPDAKVALAGAEETLKILVSAGAMRDLQKTGGHFQARYAPPREGYPQAVIAAVTDDEGDVRDWTVIPVMGEGQVEAITEPDASVRFRIGNEEFGPVRTDASGIARMVVRAGPGTRRAVAVVTDKLGNVRERTVDLGIPAHPTILALCPKAADRIVLLAIDPAGAPAVVSDLHVQTRSAKLGTLRQVAPGRFEAAVTSAPAGAAEVIIQASWKNGGTGGAHCALPARPLPAGPPPRAQKIVAQPVHRFAVAPRLGFALAGPRLTAPIGLVDLAWRPATLPFVTFGAQTGFLFTAGEYLTATADRFQAASWLVPALGRATFHLSLGRASPYATVQAGAAIAGASTRSVLTGEASTVRALPAAGGALGLEWALGPGQLAAEVSYLRGFAAGFGPHEQLNAVVFSGGYRVER